MGKVVKAVGLGILAGAIIIGTGGLGTGALSAFAAGVGSAAAGVGIGLSATLAGAIAGGIIGAGLSVLSSALSPSFGLVEEQSGSKFTSNAAIETCKAVYGECRIGGSTVFIEEYDSNGSNDVPNDTLVFARVVADHEVEGFGTFYLNNQAISFNGSGVATTSPYAGKLYLKTYDGSQTSGADSWITAADSNWDSNHIGEGVAYYVVKAEYDPEVFPYGASELLNCSIVVQGKKVYDPRLDSTQTGIGGSGSHRVDDETTWEYSTNPPLCSYDYLRDARLGNPVPDAEIDVASIAAAANTCDETVAVNGGGTITRYTLNGVIDSKNSKLNNLDMMLTTMRGRRMWLGGTIQIFAAEAITSSVSLGDDDIISATYTPLPPNGSRWNEVRGTFIDADNNYEPQEFPAQADTSAQSDEGVVVDDLNLPFTRDHREAQRLAKIKLKESRQPLMTLTCKAAAVVVAPMDVISVTFEDFGLTSEPFRVTKQTVDPEAGIVTLECLKEDSSVYSWTAATDEKTFNAGNPLTQPTGRASLNPSNVSITATTLESLDGTETAVLEVSWDEPGIAVSQTNIDYRINGDSTWIPYGISYRGDNNHTLQLPQNTTWDIRVTHVMNNGMLSPSPSITSSQTTDATSVKWISISGKTRIAVAINERPSTGGYDPLFLRFFGLDTTTETIPDRTVPATIVTDDGTEFSWGGGTTNGESGGYSGIASNGVYYLVVDTSDVQPFDHTGTQDTHVGVCRNLGASTLEYWKANVGWTSLAWDSDFYVFGYVERRDSKFVNVELMDPTPVDEAPDIFSLVGIDFPSYLPIESVGGVYTLEPSAPCTGYDNGASARIDIAATTLYFGDSTVSYSSGSVTSLSFSTDYFIYAVDDVFAGGSVTYVATTSRTGWPARAVYFGQCTTPANGAGSTTAYQGGYAGFGGARDPGWSIPV